MFYITVPEFSEWLEANAPSFDGMLVLQAGRPLLPQLLKVPEGVEEVIAAPAPDWSEEEKGAFALRIEECLMSIAISKNTIVHYLGSWEENAFWNYEAAQSAVGVHCLYGLGDYALIVGKGPSKSVIPAGNFEAYVAWSANDCLPYHVHYLGHCDHRDQKLAGACPSRGIIFTPYASHKFVETYRVARNWVYIDRGNPVAARFSEKFGLMDHDQIVGHVVDMLAQCAIYAKHTKIAFLGTELSFKTEAEYRAYKPDGEPIKAFNYAGDEVWTDEIFLTYKRGLEGLISRNPSVKFMNLSEDGLIIDGAEFCPPEDMASV